MMLADVFISYSTQDRTMADAVCHYLEEKKIRCWIAPRDVGHGQEWADAIVDAIDQCRLVVLVFSSSANDSPIVKREILVAVNKEIMIIPFRIENVLPEKAMELFISASHWLDAITPPVERHINHLIENVEKILAGVNTEISGYDPIRKIEQLAQLWVDRGCPYAMLEDISNKMKLFLADPPDEVVFKDKSTLLMLQMAALHFGSNWAYWTQKTLDDPHAVRQLLIYSNIDYWRPRLRALYALQSYDQSVIKNEIVALGDQVAADTVQVIEKYVYSQRVMDYLVKLKELGEPDLSVRVAAVIREVHRYWGEPKDAAATTRLPVL